MFTSYPADSSLTDCTEATQIVLASLDAIADGRIVVLVDEVSDTCDLVMAAERCDAAAMTFLIRYTSGFICAAIPALRARSLRLQMTDVSDPLGFGVAVDAVAVETTGISAHDRAMTARTLANPKTGPDDFTRPGHLTPIRTHPEGVLGLSAKPEAAVDLCRLAQAQQVAVISTLVSDSSGQQLTAAQAREFANRFGLSMVTVEKIRDFRIARDRVIERVEIGAIELSEKDLRWARYRSGISDDEYVVLFRDGGTPDAVPMVKMHQECFVGTIAEPLTCDCVRQMMTSVAEVAHFGVGALIYRRAKNPFARCTTNCLDSDFYRDACDILLDLGFGSVQSSMTESA
ncbi:3,4-dihydroxy-2-butanone-4-phosphate synthase [Nocardia salmonicida]|uniref:3,4-dihydroxy-2-butanone-4-phosphate synthase n=1 Tax=Nocardia salmonicida TaxID=53431 RepID=UPI00366E3A75